MLSYKLNSSFIQTQLILGIKILKWGEDGSLDREPERKKY